jgi:hypothetical protein
MAMPRGNRMQLIFQREQRANYSSSVRLLVWHSLLDLLLGSRGSWDLRDISRRPSGCSVVRCLGQRAAHDNTMEPTLQVLGIILLSGQQSAVEVSKRVRLFAMYSVVANLAGRVRHAQRDAQYVLDEQHNERRPHNVPADDEQGRDDLNPDLAAVAVNGTAWIGKAKSRATFGRGEETGADTTDKRADEMGMEHIQAVVHALKESDMTFAQIERDLWLVVSEVAEKKRYGLTQGMIPEPTPRIKAPHPATTPAAGVIATRPVIMPWIAPMTDGLL